MPLPIIAPTAAPQNAPLFGGGPGAGGLTPIQIARRRALAESLAEQASNTGPAYGGTAEMLARVLAGVTSTFADRRTDRDEAANALQRSKALARVLEGSGDFSDLAASGDPQLESMGFNMEMQRRQQEAEPSETRTLDIGQMRVTQEWDRNAREWRTIAEAPRSTGGRGGPRRPDIPRTRERYEGNEIVFEEFDDNALEWRAVSRSPRWEPDAPTAPEPTPSRTINRDDQQVTQEWDGSRWVDVADAPRWQPSDPGPPPTRELNVGNRIVTQRWNGSTWENEAEAPRSTSTPGSRYIESGLEAINNVPGLRSDDFRGDVTTLSQEGALVDQLLGGQAPPTSQFGGLDAVRPQAGAGASIGALPLPPGGPASLIAGRIYQTARGPARWDGSGFVPVQ